MKQQIIKKIFIALLILSGNAIFAQDNPVFNASDTIFSFWGDSCSIERGYKNISEAGSDKVSYGTVSNALGKADGNVISLGDKGIAVFYLKNPVKNGEGCDFAVFENAMYYPPSQDSMIFAELAKVEVSSDGINYISFPSLSETSYDSQIQSFETINKNNVYNLAGATPTKTGCGFDLNDIEDSTGINLNNITHIRISDVCGSINTQYAEYDSYGNIINDPFPTNFNSGGFDLDAVGIINSINNSGFNNHEKEKIEIYPNPVYKVLNIHNIKLPLNYIVYSVSGKVLKNGTCTSGKITVSNLKSGTYILKVYNDKRIYQKKFVK